MTVESRAEFGQTVAVSDVLCLVTTGTSPVPGFGGIGSVAQSILADQGIFFSHPKTPRADLVDLTAWGSIFATQYGVVMGVGTSRATGLSSAIRYIHRQPAQRGLLILLMHVTAGLPHGFDADIKAHQMLAVAPQRQAGR